MRVGISIISTEGQSVWSSGIGQNVFFLAKLLDSIPFVDGVYLVDCGNQNKIPSDARSFNEIFPVIPIHGAEEFIDIIIECHGGLHPEWIARFRARGNKVIGLFLGQPYAGLVDHTTFDQPGYWSDAERADVIWMTPKDAHFASFVRTIHRCPVSIAPYIWSPILLEESIKTHCNEDYSFGYKQGELSSMNSARIAILEPNTSPIKTSLISSLICDLVERRNPEIIEKLSLFNCSHLCGQYTFDFFVKNLSLYSSGKISIYAREYFTRVMANNANIVVSHQLDCSQNYLYLDALYGGYPLIHNSPFFSSVGYYYTACDAEMGASQLVNACLNHDHNLNDYRKSAQDMIFSLSPHNRQNIQAYSRLLIDVSNEKKN